MRSRGVCFMAAIASASACVACLDIGATEPAQSGGGAGGSGVGGAAGSSAFGGTGGSSASGGAAGLGGSGGGSGGVGGTAGMGGVGGTQSDGGGGTPTSTVEGVVFDGAQDWLDIQSSFQGASDSQRVTGSMWFKRVGIGQTYCIGPEAAGSGSPNQLEFTDTNAFRVVWRRAGGGVACDLATGAITDTTSWHHVAFSLDTANPTKQHMYLDGVSALSTSFYNNVQLDNTGSQWGLFADNGGNLKYRGEVADFWLAMGVYVDLSQPPNREKFRTAAGKPAELGQNGSLPTGLSPTIYLRLRTGEAPNQFAQNRGTGGGFVVHGALDIAATSPGD